MKGIKTGEIQKELDELANPVFQDEDGNDLPAPTGKNRLKVVVKLDKAQETRTKVDEYDRGGVYGFTITLNPTKIRNDKQLEDSLAEARKSITG